MPTGIYDHLNTKTPIYTPEAIEKRVSKLRGKKRPSFSEEWKRHMSKSHLGKKLLPFSKEHKEKISLALKGKPKSEEHKKRIGEGNKGKKLSQWHIERMRQSNLGKKRSLEARKKMSERKMGEKNHFWIDGRTPINKRIRMGYETKLWRNSVFSRDDYTCQKCHKRGNEIHAHHIYNFADYPSLRFLEKNGITFCKNCHLRFHGIFGQMGNNYQQLINFLNEE